MDYSKIEVYRCEHCMEFHSINEDIMQKHLQECYVNPQNQSCVRCKHLIKHNEIIDDVVEKFYYCHKLNQEMSEQDILMFDANCFECRDEKQIPVKNSDAYNSYLKDTVDIIQQKVGEKGESKK